MGYSMASMDGSGSRFRLSRYECRRGDNIVANAVLRGVSQPHCQMSLLLRWMATRNSSEFQKGVKRWERQVGRFDVKGPSKSWLMPFSWVDGEKVVQATNG